MVIQLPRISEQTSAWMMHMQLDESSGYRELKRFFVETIRTRDDVTASIIARAAHLEPETEEHMLLDDDKLRIVVESYDLPRYDSAIFRAGVMTYWLLYKQSEDDGVVLPIATEKARDQLREEARALGFYDNAIAYIRESNPEFGSFIDMLGPHDLPTRSDGAFVVQLSETLTELPISLIYRLLEIQAELNEQLLKT